MQNLYVLTMIFEETHSVDVNSKIFNSVGETTEYIKELVNKILPARRTCSEFDVKRLGGNAYSYGYNTFWYQIKEFECNGEVWDELMPF